MRPGSRDGPSRDGIIGAMNDALNAPGGRSTGLALFPGCDPRGVMTRALSPDAPAWSTRPDALIFGWLLALAPGMQAARAADAVIAIARAEHRGDWSDAQRRLLQELERIAQGRQGELVRRADTHRR